MKNSSLYKKREKTGTREWAPLTMNIQKGCEHNCRYCYARYDAVHRRHRITEEEWSRPVINTAKVAKSYRKRSGTIMFPSTHDITPNNLAFVITFLDKLLSAGNNILIVTKPHSRCIQDLCLAFHQRKEQILFRFTIGSASDNILKFWEPNAPSFLERIEALRFAYKTGFKTSVSAEPMLDSQIDLVYMAAKFWITDTFWIGKMRNIEQRVNQTAMTDDEKKLFLDPVIENQTDEKILKLYHRMKDLPFVCWKDSIKTVLKKYRININVD